ncbi:MAG: hypothetical protein ACLFSY_06145 [Desulfonatronovibrionaceae bacterium]
MMTEERKRKREFRLGTLLMAGFLVVLVLIFLPLFNAKNGMEYMDDLYNSISKGSAYYMPQMIEIAEDLEGEPIEGRLEFAKDIQVERVAELFAASGAKVSLEGGAVLVKGDLGLIMGAAVSDADDMYYNKEKEVSKRYGYAAREVMYDWWAAAGALDRVLNQEKRFDAAQEVSRIRSRALEVAYNYFGVQPEKITDKIGVVAGSLVFYVLYTLWYGFAILFMFEGSGFRLEH